MLLKGQKAIKGAIPLAADPKTDAGATNRERIALNHKELLNGRKSPASISRNRKQCKPNKSQKNEGTRRWATENQKHVRAIPPTMLTIP